MMRWDCAPEPTGMRPRPASATTRPWARKQAFDWITALPFLITWMTQPAVTGCRLRFISRNKRRTHHEGHQEVHDFARGRGLGYGNGSAGPYGVFNKRDCTA